MRTASRILIVIVTALTLATLINYAVQFNHTENATRLLSGATIAVAVITVISIRRDRPNH